MDGIAATETIVCTKCKESRTVLDFTKDRTKKGGLRLACKDCVAAGGRRYREKNREKVATSNREWREKNREKVAAQRRRYNEKNREKVAARLRDWCQKNGDKDAARKRRWAEKNGRTYYEENREARLRASRKCNRRRGRSDPFFKMCESLRRRQLSALKGRVSPGSAIKALGAAREIVIAHFESQFEPGMSWANHGCKPGQWSIDHLLPLRSAFGQDGVDLEQWQKVSHYTNLRPMWHVDNVRKNDLLPDGTRARHRCRQNKRVAPKDHPEIAA